MNKAIKLKNDTYLDSSGITHNRYGLKNYLDNIIGGKKVSYTMSAMTGWKRIASMSGMAGGNITIYNTASYGTIGQITFATGVGYNSYLVKNYKITTNGNYFTKARLVLKGSSICYLELYQDLAMSKDVVFTLDLGSANVTLLNSEQAGSIPSGYSATEISF